MEIPNNMIEPNRRVRNELVYDLIGKLTYLHIRAYQ